MDRHNRMSNLLATIVILISGCHTHILQLDNPNENLNEALVKTSILTHVWRQDFQVDSGDRAFRIQPYYDRETGSLTYAVQRAEHIPEEDGEEGEVIVYALRTLSGDGGAADLPLPVDTGEWIGQGFMDGDGLTCLIESEDENGNLREFLARYDFSAEAWTWYGDMLSLL